MERLDGRQQVHRGEGREADQHHDGQEVEERLDGEVRRFDHCLGHNFELMKEFWLTRVRARSLGTVLYTFSSTSQTAHFMGGVPWIFPNSYAATGNRTHVSRVTPDWDL